MKTRLSDGSAILTAELRGMSVQADTIFFASDTAVEFMSAIGASTICTVPAPNRVTLPPDTLTSGRVLTAWVTTPDTGDFVAVLHDSSAITPTRSWQRFRVASFASVSTISSCPPSSLLTSSADVISGARSYEVTLPSYATIAATRGAPVRFMRRVRYSAYRAGDGLWYLGYRRCGAIACAGIQPLSGPYSPALGRPLSFRYLDRNGTPITGTGATTAVARIDVVMRAASSVTVTATGFQPAIITDSALTTIAVRNR